MIRAVRNDRDLCWLAVFSITVLTLCVLYFSLIYFPALRKEDASEQLLAEAKQQLVLWKKEEKRKLRVVEAIPFLQKIQERRQKPFRSAEFSSMLSATAATSGVAIVGESYRTDKSSHKNMVQLDVEGTYEGVRGLMDEITNYSYFVLVDKFYMRVKKDGAITARIMLMVHQQSSGESYE